MVEMPHMMARLAMPCLATPQAIGIIPLSTAGATDTRGRGGNGNFSSLMILDLGRSEDDYNRHH